MHSFREDFPKFFRYTAMANDVAASLDRQVGACGVVGWDGAGWGEVRQDEGNSFFWTHVFFLSACVVPDDPVLSPHLPSLSCFVLRFLVFSDEREVS